MSNLPMEQQNAQMMEQVVMGGDLSKLSPPQRLAYYSRVCESMGLNPYTKPFDYITLNGKLTLYARKDATDQLRRNHGISLEILSREKVDDLCIVTARATDRMGRSDESTGITTIGGLKGDALANALMKAETKAKRRVTLSLVGLGWMDETEIETVPTAQVVQVDQVTGEIEPAKPEAPKAESVAAPHWTTDKAKVDRFWAWASEKMGLTLIQTYAALDHVGQITEYKGTMLEAKAAIEAYIDAQAADEAMDERALAPIDADDE
jgi:hypothetical protein